MKHNACPQYFVKAVTCGMSDVCYIFILLVTFVLIFTQISVAFQLNVWFMSDLHIHVIKETGYIVTCMWVSLWRVGKDTGYVLGRNWCSQPQMLQFISWEFMVQTFILNEEYTHYGMPRRHSTTNVNSATHVTTWISTVWKSESWCSAATYLFNSSHRFVNWDVQWLQLASKDAHHYNWLCV